MESDRVADARRDVRALVAADRRLGIVRPASHYRRLFAGEDDEVDAELLAAGLTDDALEAPPPGDLVGVAATLELLRRLPRSRLRPSERIGEGGMGAVFRVSDPALRRDLAQKVIRTDSGAGLDIERLPDDPAELPPVVQRFVGEAQVTSQLAHPGVVPVHELGLDDDGQLFFTMKLVEGRELGEVFRLAATRQAGWTRTKAVQVLIRICETLAFAHSRGIVHRDLKPANVMVGPFGEVYVMDWGLAKVLPRSPVGVRTPELTTDPATLGSAGSSDSPAVTVAGSVVGTPSYLAPEYALADGTEAAPSGDVYAVGALLYELLSGRVPYAEEGRTPLDVLLAVRRGPPPPLAEIAPDMPEELCAIAEKAMARDAADRYGSMTALGEDLHAFLDGRVVQAHRTGALVGLRKWVGRNRALAVAALAALLVVVGGTITYAARESAVAQLDLDLLAQERRSTQRIAEERDAARAAERRAEGARLAAESLVQLPIDPSRALALAIEGAERAPGPESNTALFAALREHRELLVLEGHDSYVRGARFTPDRRHIVSWALEPQLLLWDAETGELLQRKEVHTDQILTCDISPDGTRLVTGSFDGTARIWDLASLHPLAVLRPGDARVEACFAAGGAEVVTWSAADEADEGADGVLRVWDARTGEAAGELRGHAGPVLHADVTADGKTIVSLAPGELCVWDLPARSRRLAVRVEAEVRARDRQYGFWEVPLRLDPLGRAAVVDDQRVDLRTGEVTPDPVGGLVSWTPDGTRRVHDRDGVLYVRDLTTGQEREMPGSYYTGASGALVVSPDRHWVARQRHRRGVVALYGLRAREQHLLAGHAYWVSDVAFDPDGARLLTASHDTSVRVWSVGTPFDVEGARSVPARYRRVSHDGRHVLRYTQPEPGRWTVDLTHLASGSTRRLAERVAAPPRMISLARSRLAWPVDERTIRVMDLDSGDTVADVANRLPRVRLLPGGRRLVQWGARDVEVVDLATGAVTVSGSLPGAGTRWVWSEAAFHPTLPYVGLRAGPGAMVWDYVAQREVARLRGHTGWISKVAFSPCGRWLATTSTDRTARVWRAPSFELHAVLKGFPREDNAIAFTSDGEVGHFRCAGGRVLLFRIGDGEFLGAIEDAADVILDTYEADSGDALLTKHTTHRFRRWPLDPLTAARARLPRELDPAERELYRVGTAEERLAGNRRRYARTRSASLLHAWGRTCLEEGRLAEAERVFARVVAERPKGPHAPHGKALLLCARARDAAAEERDALLRRALAAIESAASRSAAWSPALRNDPLLEPLRGLAEFQALSREDEE